MPSYVSGGLASQEFCLRLMPRKPGTDPRAAAGRLGAIACPGQGRQTFIAVWVWARHLTLGLGTGQRTETKAEGRPSLGRNGKNDV